jgi:hypothetical protein
MKVKQKMRKIYSLLLVLLVVGVVSATSGEQATIYDAINIESDNFQGDIIVISGLDAYSWGSELGYLSARGFADKNKKINGSLGIRFVPVNEDGSYCKIGKNCSWNSNVVTIESDSGIHKAYLPAGDVYNTHIYFYVADDGTTYWAKSGHTEGPNSHIDLSFDEAATTEHLARSGDEQVFEPVEEVKDAPVKEETDQISDVVDKQLNADNKLIPVIIIASLLVVIFYWYLQKNKTKPKSKKSNLSTRKTITKNVVKSTRKRVTNKSKTKQRKTKKSGRAKK